MPVIKVRTEVVGFLFDAQLWLEGNQISLSYDGSKTWQSTDVLDITDGRLNILFHGVGITGTDWVLTITQLEPQKKELYKKEGKTQSTGHSFVSDSVKVS